MVSLYIVSTPIGNLGDITERAVETLKNVDYVLAEDSRVTKKLLNRFDIEKPVLSYWAHSGLNRTRYILNLLREGSNLALVTDSGTPGISDPGGKLVEKVVEELGDEVRVVPIPGPSALTAALSVSGFRADKFLFLGFPPAKRKRGKFFDKVVESEYPVVLYESPHRVIKTLRELEEVFQDRGLGPQIMVGRELTKKFESIYRGSIEEVVERIEKDKIRGEFVIVIGSD